MSTDLLAVMRDAADDQARWPGTPSWVYWLRGTDGRLLYVGVTGNLRRRFQQHAGKSWWSTVACREGVRFPNRDGALQAETALIRRYRPPHNRQLNPDAPRRSRPARPLWGEAEYVAEIRRLCRRGDLARAHATNRERLLRHPAEVADTG